MSVALSSNDLPLGSAELENAVETFLRRVRETTGILVERSPKRYGFIHLTFEEYFTAREIIRVRDDAVQKIYRHRFDPRWQEPILLAISFISTEDSQEAQKLIQSAILVEGEIAKQKGFEANATEVTKCSGLLFALRAISGCVGLPVDFVHDVVKRYLEECEEIKSTTSKTLTKTAGDILSILGTSESSRVVINYLLPLTNDSNANVRQKVMYATGKSGAKSPDVINALKTALNDESQDVRNEAAEALHQLQVDTNAK